MRSSELIIVILLIILVMFAFIYGITTTAKPKYLAASIGSKSTLLYEQEKSIIDEIIYSKRPASKTEYISWGRNPFSFPAQNTK